MSISNTYKNYSADWWTPQPWLDWAKRTLGCEPFDPCPADWSPDTHECGLTVDWGPETYCNHPGSRGSTANWWDKAVHEIANEAIDLIWCAFNVEQLRHMYPCALEIPGWLVLPRERTSFVWGGPTQGTRVHGEPARSPGNWAVWWSTLEPAPTPVESIIIRTGGQE